MSIEHHRSAIAITGTSGYLGSTLATLLVATGYEVIPVTRSLGWGGFGHPINDTILRQSAAIIHCAWDFTPGMEKVSVEGSIQVFSQAKALRVPLCINISSMSAFQGCRSEYGRAKLQLEKEVQRLNGISLRCGLLWQSGVLGGLMGRIEEQVRLQRVLLVIGSGQYPQFTTNIDDLAIALENLISGAVVAAPVSSCVNERALTFSQILDVLCEHHRTRPIRIHIPWSLLYGALRVAEKFSARLPFRSDSIIGLVYATEKLEYPSSSAIRQFTLDNLCSFS